MEQRLLKLIKKRPDWEGHIRYLNSLKEAYYGSTDPLPDFVECLRKERMVGPSEGRKIVKAWEG